MSDDMPTGEYAAPERSETPARSRPDWRDAESYRHLVELDRQGWAWEWLRRNPDYVGISPDARHSIPFTRTSARFTTIQLTPANDGAAWGLRFCRNARARGLCRAPRLGS